MPYCDDIVEVTVHLVATEWQFQMLILGIQGMNVYKNDKGCYCFGGEGVSSSDELHHIWEAIVCVAVQCTWGSICGG